jgi:hypothetical protein
VLLLLRACFPRRIRSLKAALARRPLRASCACRCCQTPAGRDKLHVAMDLDPSRERAMSAARSVIIAGAAGRMGRMLVTLAAADPALRQTGGIDRSAIATSARTSAVPR